MKNILQKQVFQKFKVDLILKNDIFEQIITMYHDDKHCKNCGQHLLLEQKFCHSCGQKTNTHRINFHYLLHEIQHGIFHVDGGILYTLKELFTRPGHSIREYIEGRRQNHFKPVLLIMILGTLTILLNHWINGKVNLLGQIFTTEGDISTIEDQQMKQTAESLLAGITAVTQWMNEHYAITNLLLIPFFALAFFIAFKKFRLNYPEWLVVSTFVTGQHMVLYILLIVIGKKIGNFNGLFVILSVGFMIWTMLQYFSQHKKAGIVLRTLLAYFLYYTSIMILSAGFISFLIFRSR